MSPAEGQLVNIPQPPKGTRFRDSTQEPGSPRVTLSRVLRLVIGFTGRVEENLTAVFLHVKPQYQPADVI